MSLSSKIKIHPLTVGMFLVGFLTGYFKYLFLIFVIVFVHECGHAFMMLLFRREIKSVELLPFGGITKVDSKLSENIFEDLLIASGGIFFQTLLGFFFIFLEDGGHLNYQLFQFLNRYNIFIIVFNLLPVCPLDGYKIFKLLWELLLPFRKVYHSMAILSMLVVVFIMLIKFEIVKDNVFVFTFLIYMCIMEFRNEPFIINRFMVERMNGDFNYTKKNIKKIKNMYKNRINYIEGRHEKEVLYEHFMHLTH